VLLCGDPVRAEKLVQATYTETGSPVTAVDDGRGFFGPVVVPVPEGADADRLFEALRLLSTVRQFSELKRERKPF